MNLPQLTATIGKAAKEEIGDLTELAMLVKNINVKEKTESYTMFMTFDLITNTIQFEPLTPFQERHVFFYHYFGNNSAASMQYFLTRDSESIHYLLGSVWNDLYLVLKRNKMEECQLSKWLLELNENGLIFLKDKQSAGSVNLSRIKGAEDAQLEDKKIIIKGMKKKGEDFLRIITENEKRTISFPIIVPRIRSKSLKEPVVLATHPDFIAVTKKEENIESPLGKSKIKRMCYVCHKMETDVSSDFTKSFNRSGINKIFGTTKINASKHLNEKYYDDNYAICSDCFQNMRFGEKKIASDFSTTIAKEKAFLIPEGYMDEFDYGDLNALKKASDYLFAKGMAQEFEDDLDVSANDLFKNPGYVIHYFIYRTDGNSVSVLDTIEDIPVTHVVNIAQKLGEHAKNLFPHIRSMTLGDIYGMIPVRTNKEGVQLDVQRVLNIYHALFSKSVIEAKSLIGYAVEAINKGFIELKKNDIKQYHNLGLSYYRSKSEEVFFRHIIMKYLCLLRTCQELGLLDQNLFIYKGGRTMNTDGFQDSVQQVERFLEEQSFESLPRALFYLGMLIRSIAIEQVKKKHENKPILNKITFQGMNQRDVIWLYQEVLEKLRQYNLMKPFNEQLLHAFNHYFGVIRKENQYPLSEQENVFYLVAGYSYSPFRDKNEADNDASVDKNLEGELSNEH